MPGLRHRAAHYILKKLGFFKRRYNENAFGRTFVIPIINGRKTYISEPWMTDIIRILFRLAPGGFIDVGANLGQTLLKVAAIDASRSYLGFEPNPACADYTTELIQANELHYHLIPAGLGPKPRVAQLQIYRNEDTDPSASVIEGFRDARARTKPVVIISLEEVPKDLLTEQVAIVKIDVEGGEADVIDGLRPLLETSRPFILMEILPVYKDENVDRLDRQLRIEATLSDLQYRMLRIRRSNDDQFTGLEALDSIGIHGDLCLSDHVMCPAERFGEVMTAFSS